MRVRRVSGVRGSLIRAVSVSVLALAAGACASDTMRFADNPFTNPFSGANVDRSPTGSIPQKPVAGAPAATATPKVASAALPPPTVPGVTSTVAQNTVNRPGAGANAAVTGFNANGWTTQGGSPVVLAQGETVNALANRYGVPAEAIYKTNGLANGSVVAPGARLTIPVYRPGSATAAAAPAPVAAAPAKSAPAKVATKPEAPAKPGKTPEKVVAAKPDAAKPKPVKAKPLASDDEDDAPAKPAAPKAAQAKPAPQAPVVRTSDVKPADPKPAKPTAAAPAPAETKVAKEKPEPQTTGAIAAGQPDFRWPARGRIISGFNNNGNQGINIAVPEGTPVKAADEGTVAYAGSELKGYGNLVLVRHSNGYVSAYAHNGELKVKKGDSVKRGQTIATAGQTGNVSSPQLHFEIRKGATPVDPSGYLQ